MSFNTELGKLRGDEGRGIKLRSSGELGLTWHVVLPLKILNEDLSRQS